MAEKSLFYNAFPDSESPTGYDRNYNADDISDWWSIVCDTGVLKGGLQVTAGSGLSISVAAGKATIKGKGYVNNAPLSFTLASAPTGSNPRYDMVVLRKDNTQTASARRSYVLIQSVDSIPAPNYLTRNGDIYDLLLAYVVVQPNATAISQIVDCRGDASFCPWFTAAKGYDDYYDAIIQQFEYNGTMAATGQVVTTNIPSSLYNNKYSLVEVFTNGLKEENTDYTVGTSGGYITITFTANKAAGAQICVVLNNFVDGEGLSTAISDYNNWVQAVAELQEKNEYTYVCNGLNDNVNITNIVNAWRSGGTDNGSARIKIVGNFGCKNGTQYVVPVGGSGTAASPYLIFNFVSGSRRVVLDFTDCSEINIPISGVYGYVFNVTGSGFVFKGLNLVANGSSAGTVIRAINSTGGIVVCEDCRFWVNGYQNSQISNNGIYRDCRGSVSNATGNTYCFQPTSIIEITGGEYYAYTGSNTAQSSIIGQSQADAVSILYGVNAPVVARSGYYQTNSILQWSGGGQVRCRDMITTLTDIISSGIVENTVAINKPNTL
jgi:hypothetical protein